MARPVVATKKLTAAAATNVALVQALGAAGALTLNGAAVTAGVATLDTARRIGLTSSANDTGITFTVTGGDYAGTAISEVVIGANAGVASTLQDFLTVTKVTGSGAVAGTVSVGTTGVGSTPWFITDPHITPFEVGVGTALITGTANWSIECTFDSPWPDLPPYVSGWSQTPPVPKLFGWPGLVGVAADASSVVNDVIAAIRLTINSGTGTVRATIRQAGISN